MGRKKNAISRLFLCGKGCIYLAKYSNCVGYLSDIHFSWHIAWRMGEVSSFKSTTLLTYGLFFSGHASAVPHNDVKFHGDLGIGSLGTLSKGLDVTCKQSKRFTSRIIIILLMATRNPANSPVEVGRFSHYLLVGGFNPSEKY